MLILASEKKLSSRENEFVNNHHSNPATTTSLRPDWVAPSLDGCLNYIGVFDVINTFAVNFINPINL